MSDANFTINRNQNLPFFIQLTESFFIPISDISSIQLLSENSLDVYFTKAVRCNVLNDEETHSKLGSVTELRIEGDDFERFLEVFEDFMHPAPGQWEEVEDEVLETQESSLSLAKMVYANFARQSEEEAVKEWDDLTDLEHAYWYRVAKGLKGELESNSKVEDDFEIDLSLF
jgi:hypothetical protein